MYITEHVCLFLLERGVILRIEKTCTCMCTKVNNRCLRRYLEVVLYTEISGGFENVSKLG